MISWIKFSIRVKLILIIMAISTAAFLLLASAAFIVFDIREIKLEMVSELYTLAEVIGNNSTAAIVFNDNQTAHEILSAMKAKTNISSASILVNSKPMAVYFRDKTARFHPVLRAQGHLFTGGNLHLLKNIVLKGKKLGDIYIVSDLEEINARLMHYLTVISIVILLVSMIIFFIAARLQRTISDPILQLVQTTKKVSRTEDYSVVVEKRSDDEIGQLFDEFNKMMRRIQSRDTQLIQAKNELEDRIEERTEQLKKSNEELAVSSKELFKALTKMQDAYKELQETQQQLLQSERMASIGQLAAGVAHEINNPIGFVSNNMELLGQYIQDYTKVLQVIETLKQPINEGNIEKARSIIQELEAFEEKINLNYIINDVSGLLGQSMRGLERVKKIVLDLKTFSREDKSEVMEYVKIESIIDGVLSIVNNELKYKAELKKEYGDTPMVKCVPQRMGQVLINLLVNAAQAIDERGEITVKTYQQAGSVVIEVTDTGKGIPQENIKKIFDPFFTTKPVGQGTGLGLSVSYEIIKKHGGDIQVISMVGAGSTFKVSLPVF